MNTTIDKNGKILVRQKKRYSVIILNINSTYTHTPRKRLLNFYSTLWQITDEHRPDASE